MTGALKHWATVGLFFAASCQGVPASQPDAETLKKSNTANDGFAWHDRKQETDLAVTEAINEPNGANFPKAIAIVKASGRPSSVIDLQVGDLVTDYFHNPFKAVRPTETLGQGLALLERASLGEGEGAELAPGRLRRMFERGLGPAGQQSLKPDPAVADCWRRVQEGARDQARGCIALRADRLPQRP